MKEKNLRLFLTLSEGGETLRVRGYTGDGELGGPAAFKEVDDESQGRWLDLNDH